MIILCDLEDDGLGGVGEGGWALTFPCREVRCAGYPSCCAPLTRLVLPDTLSSADLTSPATKKGRVDDDTVRKEVEQDTQK